MNRVYLDTNAFIATFEYVPTAQSPVWAMLNAIDAGGLHAVTRELTCAESFPKLIADDEAAVVSLYEMLFAGDEAFVAAPITLKILGRAATIRARRMSIKLPDAIHLAIALEHEGFAVITNDRRLITPIGPPRVPIDVATMNTIRGIKP